MEHFLLNLFQTLLWIETCFTNFIDISADCIRDYNDCTFTWKRKQKVINLKQKYTSPATWENFIHRLSFE